MQTRTARLIILALTASAVGALIGNGAAQTAGALYETKCGRCHVAFEPTDYPRESWPGLVLAMRSQAALTDEEIALITEYLTGDVLEGDVQQGPVLGGYLYTEYFQSQEERENFDIHYLSVSVAGWANQNIQYFGEFELEHGGKGDNVFVEQAYIDYWLWSSVAVKVGAILVPFNRFDDFHDPIGNHLVTRPQVSKEISASAWKDVGVDLHGYAHVFGRHSLTFDVYAINGLGSGKDIRDSRQYRDNNEDIAIGGRAGILLGDRFEFGGSVYRGAWDDEARYNLQIFGAHSMLRTPIADFYGEFAQAKSENAGGVPEGDMWGYFIQASRLFKRRYQPAIRLGGLDYLDEGALLGRDPAKGNKQQTELALGFAYFPVSKVVLKIEYAFVNEGDRVAPKDNDRLGLQAAVRF